MDNMGIFGPFKNPDDINKFWYQFTENELEKSIQQAKKDLEEAKNSKEDIKIYKQDRWNTSGYFEVRSGFQFISCIL